MSESSKGAHRLDGAKSSSEILDEIFKQLEEVSAKGKTFSPTELTTVLASGSTTTARPSKPSEPRSKDTTKSSSHSRHKHRHKHKHKKSKKHKSRSRDPRSSGSSHDDRGVAPSSTPSRKDSRAKDVTSLDDSCLPEVSAAKFAVHSSYCKGSELNELPTKPPGHVGDSVNRDNLTVNGSHNCSDGETPFEYSSREVNVGVNRVNEEDVEDPLDTEEIAAETEENAIKTEENAVETEEKAAETEEKTIEAEENAFEAEANAIETEENAAETEENDVEEEELVEDDEENAVVDGDDEENAKEDAESAEKNDSEAEENAECAETECLEDEVQCVDEEMEDTGNESKDEEDENEADDEEIVDGEAQQEVDAAEDGDEVDDGELSPSSTLVDTENEVGGSNTVEESGDIDEDDEADSQSNKSADEGEAELDEEVEEEDGGEGNEDGEIEETENGEEGSDDEKNEAENDDDHLQSNTNSSLPPAEGPAEPPVQITSFSINHETGKDENVAEKTSSKAKSKKRSRHGSKRRSVRSKVTVISRSVKSSTSRKRKSSTNKGSGSSVKRKKSKEEGDSDRKRSSKSLRSRLKSRSRTPPPRRGLKSRSRSPPRKEYKRRSRSRTRKSRSRSPHPALPRARRRSTSRDNYKRRRSRSSGRSRSRSPRIEKIDKAKLLEIARKNALAMISSGQMPSNLNVNVTKLKETVVVPIKTGGKSVEELTDFCKEISKKEMEDGECSDYDSNGSRHLTSDDGDDDETRKKKKEEPAPFLHHPFKLREPASIVVNIRNAVQIPTRTPAEKVAEGAKLRIQFPVSSGTQHRQKESEWVPVSPKKDAAAAEAKPVDAPKASVCTTVATMDETVFAEIKEPPPQPVLDIGAIVSQRLKAVRQLMDNPSNTEAQGQMHRSQQQMQYWAQSKQLPGLFTGSTDAQILTPQQLAGPSCQAWVRKDQFANAAPVQSGFGLHILQKMGWKPGEGLGKHGDGTALPLLLDIKLDKKGLVTAGEVPRGCRRPPVPVVPVVKDLSGKHPVSALVELCNKRRWLPPEFILVHDGGPDHQKTFLFKVRVHNVDYQPTTPSPNKKHAKAQSATICLQSLGLFPRTPNM